MEAPKDFQNRLEEVFRGRLRIRWSPKREAWHIEQQVGRAASPPYRIDPFDDSLICARDGYAFVMEVRQGTRMPCPTCHLELPVPVMETCEVRCNYCKMKGRDGRVRAAYYPLGEVLIDYLRKIDPERGATQELADEADRANRAMLAAQERALSNTIEAAGKDAFTKIAGIESVGYTGKEHSWVSSD